jgi:preprotein translocase subunit SecD
MSQAIAKRERDRAVATIRERIAATDEPSPPVPSGEITVELPGVADPDETRALIERTKQLELRLVGADPNAWSERCLIDRWSAAARRCFAGSDDWARCAPDLDRAQRDAAVAAGLARRP